MVANRAIGPLHLEDLEPHRFEDLARQLLYDFRPWRDLEATGRLGSDEGFDARATELVGAAVATASDDLDGVDDAPETTEIITRRWLIQCKREKSITPVKAEAYVLGLPEAGAAELHGLIFVAACDFSKATRDRFYAAARKRGFSEIVLWGKAELEDQLFQPKNDHILFAYTGISLQVRRRTLTTSVRARLATKRRAKKVLSPYSPALIRDASDERYPYLDPDRGLARGLRGRWKVFRYRGCAAEGLQFDCRRSFAFIDDDHEHWDYAEGMNDARLRQENPWHSEEESEAVKRESVARSIAMAVWEGLPERNRAWLEWRHVLPYDAILAIDEEGDEHFSYPHIYVGPFDPITGPFSYCYESLEALHGSGISADAEDAKRVQVFPRSPPPSA